MKRKVWILVQHLLPKRNSQSWEPNRKALAYEPWNMSVRYKVNADWLINSAFYPSHFMPGGSVVIPWCRNEQSSVSSVFIAWGYLRSNAQNRHPFHHLPPKWQAWTRHLFLKPDS